MTILNAKNNIAKHIRYKSSCPEAISFQDIKSAISMDEILQYLLESEECCTQFNSNSGKYVNSKSYYEISPYLRHIRYLIVPIQYNSPSKLRSGYNWYSLYFCECIK